jgi:anti-sigma28 factor (negative regulator of flagellin synthesis)
MKILRHPAASESESEEGLEPQEEAASPERTEKVRKLKEQIERGEYEVDEELLARKISERWFKEARPERD